jgi:hypothetical protein
VADKAQGVRPKNREDNDVIIPVTINEEPDPKVPLVRPIKRPRSALGSVDSKANIYV